MGALRVVLDTNVLLSGIAYPGSIPGKIVVAWRRGSVEVLLSDYILEELRRVLPRLAHRHGLSATQIDDLVDALAIQCDLIEPTESQDIVLRDIDDQPVLGTLLAALQTSGADYLITGDGDLLAVAQSYPIISPAGFWAAHGTVGTGPVDVE
ncbi:MAG: putative toxin-antitoxin system toxin component, PIN family [Immundisolibacter sp.]|uniref:putative toxin-antitoxin system toxin component, PIN family n=1 Tax=Immundisolibacter sp. TaxID=1934948 RepID=UPI003EDF1216